MNEPRLDQQGRAVLSELWSPKQHVDEACRLRDQYTTALPGDRSPVTLTLAMLHAQIATAMRTRYP